MKCPHLLLRSLTQCFQERLAGWIDTVKSPPLHAKVTSLVCSVTLIAPTEEIQGSDARKNLDQFLLLYFAFQFSSGCFVYSNVSFSLCIRELELLVLISVGRNLKPHVYISVLAAKNKWTHIPRSWERPDALLSLFEGILMPAQVGSGVYTHITLASKDASRGHGHGAFF